MKEQVTKEKSPLRQKDIRAGAEQERKRIIALLEADVVALDEAAWTTEAHVVREVIALIKEDKPWKKKQTPQPTN